MAEKQYSLRILPLFEHDLNEVTDYICPSINLTKRHVMTYLDFINQTYPVRNSAREKEAFRAWAVSEAGEQGCATRAEEDGKHLNLVFGNPEQARVLFTAHYDTPRRALLPNLMLPTSKGLHWAYNIGISLILVVIALIVSNLIRKWSGYSQSETAGQLIWYFSYLILFVGLFKFVMFGPKNKHNYNDNTSGTAAVMELVKVLGADERAAFILFDDEEKGKKGSKAYAKAHPEINENKLIVNMDCVANGAHFILSASKAAQAHEAYAALKRVWQDEQPFTYAFYDAKKIAMNSDQMSFKRGIGICACRKYKLIGYCTPRIHTKYDTVVSNANIDYLTGTLTRFVQSLQ